jgi:exopolyphosphatase/guanosine-5'-triphosphate,3'-diphosphate pyrophosphatase
MMLETRPRSVSSALPQSGVFREIRSSDKNGLRAVLFLAQRCKYDGVHARRVARMAVRLFDELRPLHGLNRDARYWLLCAAILHDIAKGISRHHKAAFQIVMSTPHLPFDLRTRRIVGLTARYHRKAMPTVKHSHFSALMIEHREIVRRLAAILRLADALDSGRCGLVRSVRCKVVSGEIISRCKLAPHAQSDQRRQLRRKMQQKGLMLQKVFGCKLTIKWSAN